MLLFVRCSGRMGVCKVVRKCLVAQGNPYFLFMLCFSPGYKIFIGGFILHGIYCNTWLYSTNAIKF